MVLGPECHPKAAEGFFLAEGAKGAAPSQLNSAVPGLSGEIAAQCCCSKCRAIVKYRYGIFCVS